MSALARELYVYYRVASPRWRDATQAARALQQQLCAAHPGLAARVLRRPDEQAGEVTLMEVYTLPDGPEGRSIDDELQLEIARAAAARDAWWIGVRHVERFDVLD